MASHRYGYRRLLLGCAALALGTALCGCAGNGEGLDSNGQPLGASGSGAGGSASGSGITADLQSIQNNVFTPICTQCHIGAGAPQGLQLDPAHSHALLVNVPSNEKNSVLRVKPGDPDNSYLVQKLQGSAGIIGSRMPLGQPALPQATLTAIRQWIANGALPAGASGPPAMTLKSALPPASMAATFVVTFTAPLDGDVQIAPLTTIAVGFNHDVDAALVNDSNIELLAITNGQPAHPLAIAAKPADWSGNASTILILPRSPLAPGSYRVILRGVRDTATNGATAASVPAGGTNSGTCCRGGALADLDGRTLATDYTFEFTVSAAP